MKTNQDFKNQALAALKGNWGKAVLITLLLFLAVSLVSGPSAYQSIRMSNYVQEELGIHPTPADTLSLLSNAEYMSMLKGLYGTSGLMTLLEIFLLLPLCVGYMNALRKLLVPDAELMDNLIECGFKHNYWRKVLAMLWMGILIGLWSLLLVIPGIIKAFSYAMTPFILEDNPELTPVEAIHRSRMMMRGHKFDLFWLELSFIGWAILCLFTAGIGYLWLTPYMYTSVAAFYEEVKADYAVNGGLD